MEAKDTKWCPQHGYPLPCAKCGLGLYEAGTQAGIKEVVGWIEEKSTNQSNGKLYVFVGEDWHKQLKEWEIK